MAHGGVGEPSTKKVHPFFAKEVGVPLVSQPPTEAVPTPNHDASQAIPTIPLHGPQDGTSAGSKSSISPQYHQDATEQIPFPGESPTIDNQTADNAPVDPFDKGEMLHMSSDLASIEAPHTNPPLPTPNSATVELRDVSNAPPSSHTPLDASLAPKKVLKFNMKTGTLGSPPKPKGKPKPTRIVCIKYGSEDETRRRIGSKIAAILDGTMRLPETPKKKPARSKGAKRAEQAASQPATKAKHPFFNAKPIAAASPSASMLSSNRPARAKHSIFMSTPVSPRKQRDHLSSSQPPFYRSKPAGTRVPGAMHPLWPALGMAHVRGVNEIFMSNCGDIDHRSRKSKGQTVHITAEESVLNAAIAGLDFASIRQTLPKDDQSFPSPPAELRLPKRHFESGRKLQQRIRGELRSQVATLDAAVYDSSMDELSREDKEPVHPAISGLWHALESRLSAYDRSTCENASWNHKYAPSSAVQVIQPGKEVTLMRQWLEQLKVQSVEIAITSTNDKSKTKIDAAPKKKRRKNKLDGFVVDSEDEVSESDDFSEVDTGTSSPGDLYAKRSIVRNIVRPGRKRGRLANSIVISGPSGCGKTAAVYAVAKELGFEVFEINASSRRSGKDVLEKVGDMTRNHLVQQHKAEAAAQIDDEGTMEDIKSGKQGMMTSFFKMKPTDGKKKSSTVPPDMQPKVSQPKAQKQSLILLEEVDILFEEDKQFWTSLTQLMAQSKRPFIMTCNDESLLPLQTLNLHGIFRFSTPSTNLATDICLLIAANEGHALKRQAVEALYRSRRNDLRATIAELSYWCQLGVGDRRGGFDWFYLRWPQGTDLDTNGDVVRVISEDTYLKGMGWFSRDTMLSKLSRLEMEHECATQSWHQWNLEIANIQSACDVPAWAVSRAERFCSSPERQKTLKAFDAFCSHLSDADLCGNGVFAGHLDVDIDATLPEMLPSAKTDYIIGQTLLEAEAVDLAFSESRSISSVLQLLARHNLQQTCPANRENEERVALKPITENRTMKALDSRFASTGERRLTRYDLAVAFDPIAVAPKALPTSHLDPSVFDRTMKLIIVDVAPMVRSIVAYESQLMQDRMRLSNLLSDGGKRKRMRTTRSAYSAMEGGERRTTRRERYFGDCLNTVDVLRTGGQNWQDAIGTRETWNDSDGLQASSPMSNHSGDIMT